jgi:hypothetical protein
MAYLSAKSLEIPSGMSLRQIQRCLKNGEIPSAKRTKKGGHWRIPEEAGITWAAAARKAPPPPAPPTTTIEPETVGEFIEFLPVRMREIEKEIAALHGRLWAVGIHFIEQRRTLGMEESDLDAWIEYISNSLGLPYWPVGSAMEEALHNLKHPRSVSTPEKLRILLEAVALVPFREGRRRRKKVPGLIRHLHNLVAECPPNYRKTVLDFIGMHFLDVYKEVQALEEERVKSSDGRTPSPPGGAPA